MRYLSESGGSVAFYDDQPVVAPLHDEISVESDAEVLIVDFRDVFDVHSDGDVCGLAVLGQFVLHVVRRHANPH